MMMTPRVRKFALTAHVVSSVGALGAVTAFLSLAVAGLASDGEEIARAAYVSMQLITWLVIVPSVATSITTGLIQSLCTPWGLFRHYWVLIKFLITSLVIVVLLLQTEAIRTMALAAGQVELTGGQLLEVRMSLAVHAGGGLLALLVAATLSVYKPPGMTRYGMRKQHDRRAAIEKST